MPLSAVKGPLWVFSFELFKPKIKALINSRTSTLPMFTNISPKYTTQIMCAFACILGVWVCLFLQIKYSLSSVLSAALVGFIGSWLPSSVNYDHKKVIAALYTGTFSAMCTSQLFTNIGLIASLGIITSIFYFLLADYFRGFGGKLGTIAFCSSLFFVSLLKLWGN